MTFIALSLSLIAAQATQGSAADPNDVVIVDGLAALALQPTLLLQLNGTITYRGKTKQLASTLTWSSSGSGASLMLQAELESTIDGVLVKRVVADGSTLWSYDLNLRQYSATSYGGAPGLARPDHYTIDLLNDLNWAATGPDGYMAKLLRQIYNPFNTTYTSWMPGVMSVQLTPGQHYYDPINPSVNYNPTASSSYYLYNAVPRRTIVFQIMPGTISASGAGSGAGFEEVFFNQSDTVAGQEKITSWTIAPTTNYVVPAGTFTPYSGQDIKGWRPVVAPKPIRY